MADPMPPIRLPVQREVRQRCGFGCVLCGMPLYEYHHMTPYRETQEHRADDITLLCDKHHKEATNGLLTSEQVATANANPFNVQHNVSSPYGLHFQGDESHVVIGGNLFSGIVRDKENVGRVIAISVDDIDLIWFKIDPAGNLLGMSLCLLELALVSWKVTLLRFRVDVNHWPVGAATKRRPRFPRCWAGHGRRSETGPARI